jgi:hypothetical protein
MYEVEGISMTVQHKGNQDYTGLSTDTKPTATLTAVNAIFTETDTNNEYINNGTAWVLYRAPTKTETLSGKTISFITNTVGFRSFNTIITKSGSTYYAIKYDGSILSSSATLETVIQAGLDAKGTIYWAGNDGQNFTFSAGFTGLNMSSDTYLLIAPDQNIIVPNGYTGYVFKVEAPTEAAHKKNITIQGGRFVEAGPTVGQDWTWLYLNAPDNTFPGGGILQCTFRDNYIKYPKYGVRLSASGDRGFINSNFFQNLWIDYPEAGFFFDHIFPPQAGSDGININRFVNCVSQCYTSLDGNAQAATHGFKDISGYNNSFFGCAVWDSMVGITIDSNLTSNAFNTLISGCMMTRVAGTTPVSGDWALVCDKGNNTIVDNDYWTGQLHTQPSPFLNKTGTYQGIGIAGSSTVGDGLLAGVSTGGGTLSIGADSTGLYKRGDTGAVSGTRSGVRNSTVTSARGFNPYLKIKFRLNQLTACRAYVGFCSSTDPVLTGEDLLTGLHGWGVGFSPTSTVSATNWVFYTNDASGAGTATDTGIAADTNAHTFYFAATDSVPKVGYRIDNNNAVYVTTDLPGQYSGLSQNATIINTTTASKTIDNYMWYLKQDGK